MINHSAYLSVHMPIPNPQSIPPPYLSPSVTISLFSKMCLLYICYPLIKESYFNILQSDGETETKLLRQDLTQPNLRLGLEPTAGTQTHCLLIKITHLVSGLNESWREFNESRSDG